MSAPSHDEHERITRLTKENAALKDELAEAQSNTDPWIPRGMGPFAIMAGAIFFALFTAVLVRCAQ